MQNKDISQTKEKIIEIIEKKGPLLPVNIATETGLGTLLASALLSELLAEKKISISYLRVGSSPIYYLSGQENQLEKFSQYLKNREKEAFILIKEKKILKDSEQEPAIRVALRAIRDFAKPMKKNEEIYWRYFTETEQEDKKEKPKLPEKEIKKEQEIQKKSKTTKKTSLKKTENKRNDKFFNLVKENFFSKNNIELIDIISIEKKELIFKIKHQNQEKLLVAYDKKKIQENDFLNANKKSIELNLPYIMLSKGAPSKKTNALINAIKNLSKIEKIDQPQKN